MGSTGPPVTAPQLEALRLRADPPADAAVAALAELGVRPRRGDDVLAQVRAHAKHHDALAELLEIGARVPPWVARARVEEGQRVGVRHAPLTFLVLLTGSLVESFAAARGARILAATGRLEHDTEHRVYETASMVRDLLEPGQAWPGGIGHEAMLRVRLLHAFVRRFAHRRGLDGAALGTPVNQADMLHTLLMFSRVVIVGLEALGVRISAADAEAWLHLWRWAGFVLGVEEDLLPRTVDEEARLHALFADVEYRPSDDSRRLARAVLAALADKPPFHLPAAALHEVSRRIVGDALGDALGLDRARGWSLLVRAACRGARPFLGLAHVGGLSAVTDRAGAAFIEANRRRIMADLPPTDYVFRTARRGAEARSASVTPARTGRRRPGSSVR